MLKNNESMSYYLVICGPTTSGKSILALSLAKKYNGVIVNADCLQVYSEIPIITASPLEEDKNQIPHFLYNFLPITCQYSVAQYITNASQVIKESILLGKLPIVVGGTGFYIASLLYGLSSIPTISENVLQQVELEFDQLGKEKFYTQLITKDPLVVNKINSNDKSRMIRAYAVFLQTGISIFEYRKKKEKILESYNFDVIMLLPNRNLLYQRCNQNLEKLLKIGGLDEISRLYSQRNILSYSVSKALPMPQFFDYFAGKITYTQALNLAQMRTRNYAKRQITWFKHQITNKSILEYQSLDELLSICSNFRININN